MMDLRTLEAVNRLATHRSQRERKVPVLIEPADVRAYRAWGALAANIPYIGQRVPRGFRAVRDGEVGYPLFVDSSGCGRESEPAWTLDRFLRHVEACGASWWGTVEQGQFQVYVQRYERVRP